MPGPTDAAPAPPLRRVAAHLYRYPAEHEVRTSFGVMRERPALFVHVEDEEGAVGWGEVWCNFPDCGAEHRARLIETVFAPLLEGRPVSDPAAASRELAERTAVLAIQSGERGPIHQCIAGIDIALWDLAGRRASLPLWRMLGGQDPSVRVYASGINPDWPGRVAERSLAEGHRAFKLKVGFGESTDIANLAAMREVIGASRELMADANQAWGLAEAMAMCGRMEAFGLSWIEEPLRADTPWSRWRSLAEATRIPLAAGENLIGIQEFEAACDSRSLSVIQPDVAKWGGISGCLEAARRVRRAGLRYCPHYLGAGIGLLASAHLLAAAGGDGMLEIDANPNPLRMLTCGVAANVVEGRIVLDERPGLGAAPDLQRLRPFRVAL